MALAQERARARYRASEKYRTTEQRRRERAKEQRTCAWCQTPFTTARWKPTRSCSPKCVQALRAAEHKQLVPRGRYTPEETTRWKTAQARLIPAQRSIRRQWYAGQCPVCGAAFVHDQPQTRACSPRCYKRMERDRRRARKREAFVAPVSPRRTYERDGWICQLCGRPVDRDEKAPHPSAPVVDHIVPLARGGTHEPGNVQCAHFICNSIKSDRVTAVQPMLF